VLNDLEPLFDGMQFSLPRFSPPKYGSVSSETRVLLLLQDAIATEANAKKMKHNMLLAAYETVSSSMRGTGLK
jgi:hypothetical protein